MTKIHSHLHGAFGQDTFGQKAEGFARFFGTPKFILIQSFIVAMWIAANAVLAATVGWDPYPFILLNLVFSTQAAYAAPLILLAQTRQADRDKAQSVADATHREEIAAAQSDLLAVNTKLTEEIHSLTAEIHTRAAKPKPKPKKKKP